MPTHERLGPDDRENLQGCWKPAIQLDKGPAITVREPNATTRPAPQNNQLTSQRRILGFKSQLDLNGEAKTARAKQNNPIIAPAWAIPTRLHTRMRFSVHTMLPERLVSMSLIVLPRCLRVDVAYRCFVVRRFPIG